MADASDCALALYHLKDAVRSFVPRQVYHVDNFLKHFPNLDKSMLPVFASLCGNDVVNTMELKGFYNEYSKIDISQNKWMTLKGDGSKTHERIVKLLLWINECEPSSLSITHSIIEKALSFLNDRNWIDEVRQKINNSTCSMESYQIEDVYVLFSAFESKWDPFEVWSEFKQLEAFNIPR